MSEDKDLVIYFPTDLDKAVFTGLCNEIIDLLEPLRIEQKAFLLAQLVSSFEDVSNIKFSEIYTDYRDSQNESNKSEDQN